MVIKTKTLKFLNLKINHTSIDLLKLSFFLYLSFSISIFLQQSIKVSFKFRSESKECKIKEQQCLSN